MSNGDEAILEVKGLKVGIEDTPILKGIDLRIPKGEIHAIMGRNGSGKTTTANVIMGHPAYDVEEGEILLDGENLQEMEPWERSRTVSYTHLTLPTMLWG